MTQVEPLASAITTVFANVANNVVSQIAAAMGSTDTTLTLLAGTGAAFPVAPFYCSVEYEVMWCSTKNGDVLSIQRGVDGTSPAAHPINSIIQIRNNAGLFHDAYNAIQQVDQGVTTGTSLPADIAYTDKTQEFTNKTIDLTNPSKGNVIIGTVSPDPTQIAYPNILRNSSFDTWTFNTSTTIAAGTPTSGHKGAYPINEWILDCVNDSSVTIQQDTANVDPAEPSRYDALLNLTTVQANDVIQLWQSFIKNDNTVSFGSLNGAPISASARIKLVSGNVQAAIAFQYTDNVGTPHTNTAPFVAATASYSTIKYENQVWVPAGIVPIGASFILQFKGVGQIAVDNVFAAINSVVPKYVPRFPEPPVVQENYLVNGGFEQWQRGTAFGAVNNAFTADRWYIILAAPDNVSVAQEASITDGYGKYSLHYTVAHTSGSAGVAQSFPFTEQNLAGKYITISVRVRCDVVGGVILNCYDSMVGSGGFVCSISNSLLNIWETLTVSGFVHPSATSLFIGLVSQLASCNVYVDNASLTVGQVPAKYIPRHPADELARCLRYYEKRVYSFRRNAVPTMWDMFPLMVQKGGTPTVTNQPGTRSNISSLTFDGSQQIYVSATIGGAAGDQYSQYEGFTVEWNP